MDNRESVRERFGRAAQGYVSSPTHAAESDLARIVAVSGARPDSIVLDIATGGGHTAIALAPHVARVVATDITPEMLDSAREHAQRRGVTNIEFAIADAESLPFDDRAFDIVTCRIAAHHFPRPERFAAEVARVLRAGGTFVMQDQIVPEEPADAAVVESFESLRDPSHAHALPLSQWLALLEAAGLSVESVDVVVKRHPFLDWAALQSCTPGTVVSLQRIVEDATPAARAWLEPEQWGTPAASFVNRHVILSARR
jgi:ubiquinone/menaquinone biosynthesis C-methylase UbiE